MDSLIEAYYNFCDWYMQLWLNAIGETGVEITRVITTTCAILLFTTYFVTLVKNKLKKRKS